MRLSFGGTLGVPAIETWSNTLRFHFGGIWTGVPVIGVEGYEPDRDQLQDMCNQAGGAIGDWMSNASANINQNAIATWCKLNWIKADGTQRDVNTVVTDFTPVPGASALAGPWSTTSVVTLRTAVARGRAHSGRIYPPMTWGGPFGNGASPYIPAGKADDIAAAAAAMISSLATRISDVIDVPAVDVAHPVVISPGSHLKGTTPLAYDVISCVVDRVPDVMHSRTRNVPRLEGLTAPIT